MSIFSNSWVIGIGGGILSGFIVTYISRKFFSGQENKLLLQKITSANREVIFAIRSTIAEGALPKHEVITALLASTARKYGVSRKELYSIGEVADDLVKEVMDSSFISSKTKSDYCDKLANLKRQVTPAEKEIAKKSFLEIYRNFGTITSLTLGMTAMVLTATLAFKTGSNNLSNASSLFPVAIPTLAVLFSVIVVILMTNLIRKTRRSSEENWGFLKTSHDYNPNLATDISYLLNPISTKENEVKPNKKKDSR